MAELGWIIHKKSKLKLGLNLEKFSEREDYDYHGREVGWAIQKMLGRLFHVSKLILHMSRN